MEAEEVYGMCKSYTDDSLNGLGAVAGKPCTIKSITNADTGTQVTFEWTGEDGTKQTQSIVIPKGEKGDTGDQGEKGDAGYSPTITATCNANGDIAIEVTGEDEIHITTITNDEITGKHNSSADAHSDIRQAIQAVRDGLLDNIAYSADYKKLVIAAKNGTTHELDVAPIISHADLEELHDIDSTTRSNGYVLTWDATTNTHKYTQGATADNAGLVKMDSASTAKYLEDQADKTTIKNVDGKLVVKNIDGLEASIQELNYIKGLTMPVQSLVNAFANGGLKLIDTPFADYATLAAYSTEALLDGISYLTRVLADETKENKITAYMIKKGQTAPVFYGYLTESRDFTTAPINLTTEVTGKLPASNIDTASVLNLISKSDTYKTATENNEIFSTHGANAMYTELTSAIGAKALDTDLTAHTGDTDIHVNALEKEKWDKVTDKIDKSQIKKSVSQTPSDTNLLSEKAIVALTTPKITCYTKLEQLGLQSGCSTGDIFNALPDNSYVEIGCNLSKTDTLYNVSDLPADYGLLTIRKYDKTRFAIELKLSGGSVISPNEMWIGQLKGADGTSVTWKRVCTTSIADVELTPITLDATIFTSATKAYYQVINGVCHINFMTGNFKNTLTGAIAAKTIATGLPKPNTSQIGHTFIPWAGVSAGQQVIFFVDNNGKLILHTTDKIANACVYTSFSYPVKE